MSILADSGQSRVQQVVEESFRRSCLVLLVEHSAIAWSTVFCGLIVLLILGTQIFDARWLLLLALGGSAVMFIRVRGRILSRYRVAQTVDRRLELHDSLSTAWYLLEGLEHPSNSFAEAQFGRAEQTARSVQAAAVFPFVWKRAWALTGALATVAFGLFALRYLVTSSLSFKESMVPLSFSLPADVLETLGRLAGQNRGGRRVPLRGGAIPGFDKQTTDQIAERTGDRNRTEMASDKHGSGMNESHSPDRANESGRGQGEQPTSSPSSSTSQGADPQKSDRAPNGTPNQPEAKESSRHGSDSSGLMNQMKDALSGLMAKMHPQESGTKSSERSPEQKSGEQGSSNRSKSDQAQSTQNSQSNDGEDRQQNSAGQQTAQASEKSPSKQSQASDASSSRRGADSQSGVGRQDGEKNLREAEQLRAMGKLDEIIGKRSASLSGDMTVETHSSHQALQTQYSGRVGHHEDLGRQIDRDEVPLPLQQYVRDYMEQVHKEANNRP